MFRLLDNGLAHTCRGFNRREFLRIGSLALGGFTLPGLLAARAKAPDGWSRIGPSCCCSSRAVLRISSSSTRR